MDTLLGFHVSGWDYLTFLVIFIIGGAFFACHFHFRAHSWLSSLPMQLVK